MVAEPDNNPQSTNRISPDAAGTKVTDEQAVIAAMLGLLNANIQQAHHHENQRSMLTNFLVTINVAATAFVVQQKFEMETIPVALAVFLLGIFGSITTVKFSQRFHLYYQRARQLEKILSETMQHIPIEAAMKKAAEVNVQKFGKAAAAKERIELYQVWAFLHQAFVFCGAGLLLALFVLHWEKIGELWRSMTHGALGLSFIMFNH